MLMQKVCEDLYIFIFYWNFKGDEIGKKLFQLKNKLVL